jgi:7-cyano-7-deazaguanine synthase
MTQHVVVLSGGMDSYTLLHRVLDRYDDAYALTFDYNQRHRREIDAARRAVNKLGLTGRHQIIPIPFLHDLAPKSALTGDVDVPHGHYAADNMKQTIVPGRNTVLLSIALAYAEGKFPGEDVIIYYGAHAGDHTIYPDCRPEYVRGMQDVITLASLSHVQLRVPYLYKTKADILLDGFKMRDSGRPIDYADTWTCYAGSKKACGLCGSCTERLLSFDIVGEIDPLEYQDREAYKLQAS